MTAVLLVVVAFIVAFVVSGVWPRYRNARDRLARVKVFEEKYAAFLAMPEYGDVGDVAPPGHDADARETPRRWLAARQEEMQRDAESVSQGVMHVAPPPMIGGGQYLPHRIFADLFGVQSFTGYPYGYRLDVLAKVIHQLEVVVTARRRDLLNPWAWIRLTFERLVRFPRYVLRIAGFGTSVTDSNVVRGLSAVWGFLIGAGTIVAGVAAVVELASY